jgi:hypothetical protein
MENYIATSTLRREVTIDLFREHCPAAVMEYTLDNAVELSGGLEQEQKGGKLKAMFLRGAQCMPKQGQREQTEKQNNTDTDPDMCRPGN